MGGGLEERSEMLEVDKGLGLQVSRSRRALCKPSNQILTTSTIGGAVVAGSVSRRAITTAAEGMLDKTYTVSGDHERPPTMRKQLNKVTPRAAVGPAQAAQSRRGKFAVADSTSPPQQSTAGEVTFQPVSTHGPYQHGRGAWRH